jgi:hypothetical protein
MPGANFRSGGHHIRLNRFPSLLEKPDKAAVDSMIRMQHSRINVSVL